MVASIMFGPLKLPCRRVFSAAHVNLDTCRKRSIQCSGVRGYANSFIEKAKADNFSEVDKPKVTSESSPSSTDTPLRTPSQPSNGPSRFELQDLPPLPPFPAKPTIHISPEDITTYLQPLISRLWRVGRVRKGVDEDEVLSLNRHYNFKNFNEVMDFVKGIAEISREEKHHARILFEYSHVVIFTHTHSAYTFHRLPNGKYESRKVPGLTRRDIRFAMKIEELHEKLKTQGHALESAPPGLGMLQRMSMTTLQRRYGKTRTGMEYVQSKSVSDATETQDKVSSNGVSAV
ncbi:hypothetical protein M405DRAFT_755783 [Rhizopogon salebrosus TDB-379]|nr:hypothetical protein M405DRAFT_755783 [Rhizopogon salebrosus TDB-379]